MKNIIVWILTAGLVLSTLTSAAAESTPSEAESIEPQPTTVIETTATSEVTITPEVTETPQATVTPESTATNTPEATATIEVTATPAATPTPDPVSTPTPVPTQAYLKASDTYMRGKLSELVEWCVEEKRKDATIYLTTKDVITLSNRTVEDVADITFEPDREMFPDERDIVIVSAVSPSGTQQENTLYVWVGRKEDIPQATNTPSIATPSEPTSQPQVTPTPTPAVTITPEPTMTAEESQAPSGQANGMGASGQGNASGGAAVVTRVVPHAKSTQEHIVAYDGVDLVLIEDEMNVLNLGGETLAVSLEYSGEDGGFTAQLLDWNSAQEDIPNALMLCAPENAQEDYIWSFSGQAAKTLAASGIEYLVLQSGDQVTAISTAGFTAGPGYSLLRTQGVPSKEFNYQLVMTGEDGTDINLTLCVKGETSVLTQDPDANIYYYDIYTGSLRLLDAPFGVRAQ